MTDIEQLRQEAAHLHQCFFRRPMPAIIGERYSAAHRHVFGADTATPRYIREVIRRGLDAEAVEYALRRRARRDLTIRIQILFYLLEVRSDYFEHFVAVRPGRLRALFAVLAAAIRSGWKLVKGEFLIRRYGLL